MGAFDRPRARPIVRSTATELGLTIRDVSQRTGITAHTLRYYERIGLVQRVPRAQSGHRRYGESDLRWLSLVKKLHESRMPIRKMLEYARLMRRGDGTVEARRALLDAHRLEVEAELASLRATLETIGKKLAKYDRALSLGPSPPCRVGCQPGPRTPARG